MGTLTRIGLNLDIIHSCNLKNIFIATFNLIISAIDLYHEQCHPLTKAWKTMYFCKLLWMHLVQLTFSLYKTFVFRCLKSYCRMLYLCRKKKMKMRKLYFDKWYWEIRTISSVNNLFLIKFFFDRTIFFEICTEI